MPNTDLKRDYRIVSVCPSNTELIANLGLARHLVGVDNYSDYPGDVVKDLPRLGPDLQIDIDAVKALRPDLVVSSLSVPGMEHVVEAVSQAGLRQVVLSPHSLAGVYEDLRKLAAQVPEELLAPDAAESLIASLEGRVERISRWIRQNALGVRPKLYWEWWPNPVFSPGMDNWLTEISQLAGAQNIFADVQGDAVQDDGSKVARANPDWFLAVWTGVPQHKVPLKKILSRDEQWQQTTAFRKKQLWILSEGLFCRPSPRLVDGLEQLVGLLYPDAVEELHLKHPAAYAPVQLATGEWL